MKSLSRLSYKMGKWGTVCRDPGPEVSGKKTVIPLNISEDEAQDFNLVEGLLCLTRTMSDSEWIAD